MKCNFCDANAQYRDPHSGQYACLTHSRLQVTAQGRADGAAPPAVRPAEAADRAAIAALAHYFWGEVEVECFAQRYDVRDLPAFVACDGDQIVGLLSYAIKGDALNLVMLNVLPDWQGRGAGRALVAAVEALARAQGVTRLIVATSNDDLPALYFYQRCGFSLSGLAAGRLVEHHGGEEPGFAGLPVRDEIQLVKCLSGAGGKPGSPPVRRGPAIRAPPQSPPHSRGEARFSPRTRRELIRGNTSQIRLEGSLSV